MDQIIVLSAAKDPPWFKCEVIMPIGGFEVGDQVYVKRNTEYPIKAGDTYWIFGVNSLRIAHVGRDVGAAFIKSAYKRGRDARIATPEQTHIIDKRFAEAVKPIIDKWRKDLKKYPLTPSDKLRFKNKL